MDDDLVATSSIDLLDAGFRDRLSGRVVVLAAELDHDAVLAGRLDRDLSTEECDAKRDVSGCLERGHDRAPGRSDARLRTMRTPSGRRRGARYSSTPGPTMWPKGVVNVIMVILLALGETL